MPENITAQDGGLLIAARRITAPRTRLQMPDGGGTGKGDGNDNG
ncbi:hypothetical protein [Streptomyces sp. NPDC051162]